MALTFSNIVVDSRIVHRSSIVRLLEDRFSCGLRFYDPKAKIAPSSLFRLSFHFVLSDFVFFLLVFRFFAHFSELSDSLVRPVLRRDCEVYAH